MRLPQDFKEFLQLLNDNGVEYLVIGGYAVSFHGYVRPTGDIDIWVESSPENARRLTEVFRGFGFAGAVGSGLDLSDPSRIYRLGIPPVRIEIMTAIDGVTFLECLPHRIVQAIDGISIPFIDLDHLKKNKRASGRHKDLDDLEHLP